MSDYQNLAFTELQSLVASTWSWLGLDDKQLRDTQAVRVKWLEFVQRHQSGEDTGLEFPYIIEEFSPWVSANGPDGFGYAGDNQRSSCSVFLVDSTDPLIATVTALPVGNQVTVDSTERFFAGQNLVDQTGLTPPSFKTVVSVDSSTTMTLSSVSGIVQGVTLTGYDKTEQLLHEAYTLRDALDPKNSFTNFFTMELATVDAGASNPANAVLSKVGHNVQAVQISFDIFIGL
jgi:hypothetical protein